MLLIIVYNSIKAITVCFDCLVTFSMLTFLRKSLNYLAKEYKAFNQNLLTEERHLDNALKE